MESSTDDKGSYRDRPRAADCVLTQPPFSIAESGWFDLAGGPSSEDIPCKTSSGGERGIRTPGAPEGTTDFEAHKGNRFQNSPAINVMLSSSQRLPVFGSQAQTGSSKHIHGTNSAQRLQQISYLFSSVACNRLNWLQWVDPDQTEMSADVHKPDQPQSDCIVVAKQPGA